MSSSPERDETEEKLLAEEQEPSLGPVPGRKETFDRYDIAELHHNLGLDRMSKAIEDLAGLVKSQAQATQQSSESGSLPVRQKAKKRRTEHHEISEESFQAESGSLQSAKRRKTNEYSAESGSLNSARVHGTTQAEVFDPTLSLASGSEGTDAGESTDEEVDLPPSVFDSEDVGPKISNSLATRITDAFTKKPIEEKMKAIGEKYKTPENCPLVCIPKVNQALWSELPRASKLRDLGMQEIQKSIVKASQALAQMADDIIQSKKNNTQPKPKELLGVLSDSLTFLGNACYQTSLKRRENLKPELSKSFQALCLQSTPVTQSLFGDDLAKHVDEIAKANKITSKVFKPSSITSTKTPSKHFRRRSDSSRPFLRDRYQAPRQRNPGYGYKNYSSRDQSRNQTYSKKGDQTKSQQTNSKTTT